MKHELLIPKELCLVICSSWISEYAKITALHEYFDDFKEEILSHFDLSPYRSDKCRGEIDGDSVMFTDQGDDGVVLTNTNSGSVFIEFEENAYYGCRDMDDSYHHQEEVSFIIDTARGTIEFTLLDDFEREDEI